MGKSILIVDDDPLLRSFFSTILREEGYSVEEKGSGKEALLLIREREFDLVITDLRMPDMSGIDLLREGQALRPATRWIIVTAFGSIENAVHAMKEGASDYLTKPLKSPEELRHVVRRIFRETEREGRIALLSEELGRHFPPPEMVFMGQEMAHVRDLVHDVAPTGATVLITGQSGTGKELVARTIHQLSTRKEKPFIAVHCTALVETLLESELFGHERGAFTGAVAMKKGRFEQADGGTIFLDEVGEIPPAVQVKLLRVLQEKEFERVGGTASMRVNIRVISATNRDLRADISSGRFREDLYYRLSVFPIHLPPLIERREAIIPLAQYFVEKSSISLGKRQPVLTPEAQEALLGYRWPGNIRELQNVIERAVILAKGEIGPHQLNLETPPTEPIPGEGLLKIKERELVEATLRETGGNRRLAAEKLGISLRTLQYRLKEYGL